MNVKVIWSRNGIWIDCVTFDLYPSCLALDCMNEIENYKQETIKKVNHETLKINDLLYIPGVGARPPSVVVR